MGKVDVNPNVATTSAGHTRGRNDTGILGTPPNVRNTEHLSLNNSRIPKFDFLKFSGENPRLWLRKCNKYFIYHALSDFEKIVTAGMNIDGMADHWYLEYIKGKENMSWDKFTSMVLDRFLNEEGSHVIGQFNKLRQEGTVQDYILEFEELRAFMLDRVNKTHSEEYFMESFISGLKTEIREMLELLKPQNLMDAMKLARKQESRLTSKGKESKVSHKMQGFSSPVLWRGGQNEGGGPMRSNILIPNQDKIPPVKRLAPEEFVWYMGGCKFTAPVRLLKLGVAIW
ncbi:hypothetical protein DH2020_030441 [Rehmannia glutinosa]|uniref:Ty3 transposon capsid-like protein domain-containing protein n=1 Tax=Rehmannia glutinosa TaxID=99300 RepID=A0ABR0VKX3_REHGL